MKRTYALCYGRHTSRPPRQPNLTSSLVFLTHETGPFPLSYRDRGHHSNRPTRMLCTHRSGLVVTCGDIFTPMSHLKCRRQGAGELGGDPFRHAFEERAASCQDHIPGHLLASVRVGLLKRPARQQRRGRNTGGFTSLIPTQTKAGSPLLNALMVPLLCTREIVQSGATCSGSNVTWQQYEVEPSTQAGQEQKKHPSKPGNCVDGRLRPVFHGVLQTFRRIPVLHRPSRGKLEACSKELDPKLHESRVNSRTPGVAACHQHSEIQVPAPSPLEESSGVLRQNVPSH